MYDPPYSNPWGQGALGCPEQALGVILDNNSQQ